MQKATNRSGGKQDFGDGSCQKVAMDGWTVNEGEIEAWEGIRKTMKDNHIPEVG